jgi:type IV pilus biogenesis protein CpaD/CtpE
VSPVRRRVAFVSRILLFSAATIGLVACADTAPARSENAPIGIENSQLSIVIENKVGMPLTDVDVSIVPIGGATEFRKFVGRMENAEKRDLSLGAFYGRDGTTFSLRVVRPKTVRVTGKDLNAKPYSVESRWQ